MAAEKARLEEEEREWECMLEEVCQAKEAQAPEEEPRSKRRSGVRRRRRTNSRWS